ncbi:MetQ/NlpA family ABC transporter substrate-binding protein [Mammaliicoccus stepanovicii]|uniref:Lipoprotein n=1 Tax=Mammaliicoccus stepanovicii TaxID=643214 RepID=A0A239ZV12_9STAP|nr:MetQ/NlpA family ABC transporter substrate-binding protein [Mammaliicoccus stepanovicii]PNZ77437.1 methionine ABC transporter substrate-binding protein [Mammaliicoccus stepanovicii]GGI39029.1 lipoprotein [Mammaliicoccus stepanovicii]SNV74915.1 ABC transporter substrate-binding protein [Mammaliicoccus stepanovicii]
MRKIFGLLLVAVLTIVLAACGGGDNKDKKETIKIGASPAPHAEILEEAKPLLEKEGYNLEIKTINDYTTPNKLLDKGELDANFFQHTPYLKTESKEKGYKIESAGNVHIEPMAVYSKKYKHLKDLPKGATVYVSNNPAEEGRFLSFFTKAGLIEIKDGVNPVDATFDDITENKKNIKFNNKQSAEFLPKSYQADEGDATIINSNYAIEQKLNPIKDSIAVEGKDSPYANLIAVQKGHKDDKKVKALMKVLQSKEIKDFINKKYDGAVISAK